MPTKPSGRSSSQSRTAFQRFKEQLKYVDLVIEVLDARVPLSSRHPGSQEIFGNKPRLLIMAKEDLADPLRVKSWINYYKAAESERQAEALALSLKMQKNKDKIFSLVLELTKDKHKQLEARGLLPRPIRICVVGMPNVGKSSLINWMIGQKKTKVGDRPGITKGAQWVRVHPKIELLDTPGILPAFAYSPVVAKKLALFNLLPEALYDVEEVAVNGLDLLRHQYPKLLEAYISGPIDNLNLEGVARKRNFLAAGGIPDLVRAANVLVTDIRHGKLGRVTLDQPESRI